MPASADRDALWAELSIVMNVAAACEGWLDILLGRAARLYQELEGEYAQSHKPGRKDAPSLTKAEFDVMWGAE